MVNVISENFEGAADGVAVSAVNSTVDGFSGTGTAVFSTAWSVKGTRSVKIPTSVTVDYSLYFNTATLTGSQYVSAYLKLPAAAPTTIQPIMRWTSTNTNKCQVALNTTGKLVLRDVATAVATSTGTYTNSIVRLEWDVVGTTQTLRIYSGANLHTTTPTETLTGAFTSAAVNRLWFGTFGPYGVADNLYVDRVMVDDAVNPGPLRTMPVAYWFDGITQVPLATPVMAP